VSGDVQTRNYYLQGVNINVSCSSALAACLDARFRLLATGARVSAQTISFEFESVANSSQHTIELPNGEAKPFYELPNGQAYCFENGDQLYISLGAVRALCQPASGTASFSVVESERGSLFLASHLFFTIFLMEILKRREWYSVHAAGFSDSGRAVLIPGTSGAGKSTLSIGLLRAKFDYLSDDMVFLLRRPAGWGIIGLPEDVDVTDKTIGFFSELDFLLSSRKADGFPKWQVRAEEVYGTKIEREARPGAIVFPRISGNPTSAIRQIEPDEALFEMVPNVLLTEPRSCQAHLNALADLVKHTPCYRLETGRDFDHIPHLFRELLSVSPEEARV
jgi:hypothetical protein